MLTLVTGATGLVGNNVVRLLLKRGQSVRVLARSTSDPRPLAGLDIERAEGDVTDPAAVCRAVQGVDRVVHAAARVHIGWTGLAQHHATNVEGTRNIARAARDVGARMIHVSSVDALGLGTRAQPADEEHWIGEHVPCPYVLTKRGAEQALLEEVERGLNASIVNPVFVLGPWDWKPSSGRMLIEISKGKTVMAPRGGNDFCDARRVAWAILSAFERGQPGRRYILGGESLSYLEAWRIFAEITGGRPPVARFGPIAPFVGGLIGDLRAKFTGHEPDINSAAIKIASKQHHYSDARARRELGYEHGTAREAATAAWEWFQEHGYV